MSVPEPVLNVAEIQGNILAGFNKDFQSFLFLRIRPQPADVTSARHWLKNTLAPQLSNTDQVLAFNRAFRAARSSGGALPTATWVNVGFSAAGIGKLRPPAEVAQFGDEAFTRGLTQRSEFLGDPTDPAAIGNRRNWVVGGTPEKAVDIVVIVASDQAAARQTTVDALLSSLAGGGLDLFFRQ